MQLLTTSQVWQKARSVNQTSAAYVSKVPTATEPAADSTSATASAAIDLQSTVVGSGILAMFYGIGANNTTFSCRIIGWKKTGLTSTALWIPTVICEVDLTLDSSVTGVAATDILDTESFVDTIALAKSLGTETVSSTTTAVPSLLAIGLCGSMKFEFSFKTGSSATSCNALYVLM